MHVFAVIAWITHEEMKDVHNTDQKSLYIDSSK